MYVGLNDIIKFGRVRFRIRKLCLNYEDESQESENKMPESDNIHEYISRNF